MKSLSELWRYVRPYRGRIWVNMFFNTLSSLFAVFSLLMLIPFLKLLFQTTERIVELPAGFELGAGNFREQGELWLNFRLSELIETQGELRALLLICLVVIVVFFFKNLFRYLALYVVAIIKKGTIKGLHADLYNKLLRFPMSYFDKQRKGDLLSRFTSDVQEVEYGIIFFLEAFIKDPITILITLTTMVLISPQLTLIVLITLPISGLIIGVIGKQLKRESREVQRAMAHLVNRLEETLSGMRVIKSYAAEDYVEDRFSAENEHHFNWSVRMLRKRDLSSPLAEFLGILVVVIILWLGGRMVFNGQIAPETFITFIVIFSQVISPSKAFANAYYYIQRGLASMERIEEVVLHRPDRRKPGTKLATALQRHVVFEQVSFAYESEQVLQDIDLVIHKGERIALTGPSGSGKSTLTDLLLGLYPCTDGAILVDDVDLRQLNMNSWRETVAVVPQDTVLFHDSLLNNIRFGQPKASDDAVKRAAKQAGIAEFIDSLPGGFDHIVSDNGGNLSGGQRQRIAIARALLKDASILIMDEATSALDADNERIIAETLRQLPGDKTFILIAHRSDTLQLCDRVVELRDGRIVNLQPITDH